MIVKEIRIGDYVNYRGQIIKVTSLYDKGGSNEVGWSDKESVWVNADNVEPIPLTQEILEKNGFKQMPGTKYFPSTSHVWINKERFGTIMIQVSIYEKPVNGVKVLTKIDTPCLNHGGVNSIHNCNINYVHELQNAIRLCCIEKEIIL